MSNNKSQKCELWDTVYI